jgi:hypothetical protein
LHLRYAFNESKSVFRLSGGRALRTPNLFAENTSLMASARVFEIHPSNTNLPYGLNAEVAWNYGINYTQKFKIDFRDAYLTFDVYRTDFEKDMMNALRDIAGVATLATHPFIMERDRIPEAMRNDRNIFGVVYPYDNCKYDCDTGIDENGTFYIISPNELQITRNENLKIVKRNNDYVNKISLYLDVLKQYKFMNDNCTFTDYYRLCNEIKDMFDDIYENKGGSGGEEGDNSLTLKQLQLFVEFIRLMRNNYNCHEPLLFTICSNCRIFFFLSVASIGKYPLNVNPCPLNPLAIKDNKIEDGPI